MIDPTHIYIFGPPVAALAFLGAVWVLSSRRTKALDVEIAAYRAQEAAKSARAKPPAVEEEAVGTYGYVFRPGPEHLKIKLAASKWAAANGGAFVLGAPLERGAERTVVRTQMLRRARSEGVRFHGIVTER